MYVSQLLFVKFISINWFNLVILLLLFFFASIILKEIKYTHIIKKTVQQHYSLFQFINNNKDTYSKERLVRAVFHDIVKTNKRMNPNKIERRTKFEITLMLLPMGFNILTLIYRTIRIFILLIIIFMMYVIISMTYESIKENNFISTPIDNIKKSFLNINPKENSEYIYKDDSSFNNQKDTTETKSTKSNDPYRNKITALLKQAQDSIGNGNYEVVGEIIYSLDSDARLENYSDLYNKFIAIQTEYNQLFTDWGIPWAPGIQEQFEAEILKRGYIEPGEKLVYKFEDGNRYSLYSVKNGEEIYIVVVDVKTGWFHG